MRTWRETRVWLCWRYDGVFLWGLWLSRRKIRIGRSRFKLAVYCASMGNCAMWSRTLRPWASRCFWFGLQVYFWLGFSVFFYSHIRMPLPTFWNLKWRRFLPRGYDYPPKLFVSAWLVVLFPRSKDIVLSGYRLITSPLTGVVILALQRTQPLQTQVKGELSAVQFWKSCKLLSRFSSDVWT